MAETNETQSQIVEQTPVASNGTVSEPQTPVASSGTVDGNDPRAKARALIEQRKAQNKTSEQNKSNPKPNKGNGQSDKPKRQPKETEEDRKAREMRESGTRAVTLILESKRDGQKVEDALAETEQILAEAAKLSPLMQAQESIVKMRTDAQAKKDSLLGWQKVHVVEPQTYTIAIQFLEQSVKDAEAEVEAMQAHVASLKETLSEFNDDYAQIVEKAKPKTKAKKASNKPKADKPKTDSTAEEGN